MDEMLSLDRTHIDTQTLSAFIYQATHLFEIQYCIRCLFLMNGAETKEETDERPLYLCPICLRKIYSALGKDKKQLNVIQMYPAIVDLCKRFHFKDELT
jgi:hypothetical protein